MFKLFRRITYLLRQRRIDRELAQEVEFHRAMEAERLERAGLDRRDAHHASLRVMGNVTLAREDSRAVWIAPWFEGVRRDVRYAMRTVVHRPGFAIAMILVMGLGIGATTAVFTLLDSLVLKSLPVRTPEQLVFLQQPAFSYPQYSEIRSRAGDVFSDLFAWNIDRVSVQWSDALESSDVLMASGQFYSTLGISAEIGQTFEPSDDRIGGGPRGLVGVISYSCWQRRFERDPGVVGRRVRLGQQIFTIIGVTPPGFFGVAAGLDPEITIPLTTIQDDAALRSPSSAWLHVMGRLKPTLSLEQANAAFAPIWPAVLEATTNPGMPADRRAMYLGRKTALGSARTGFSRVRKQFQEPLWLLLGLVGLLLAVACASAANLLLARGIARRREIAVRLAIGASRARLVRQMLTEAFIWTILGGCAGLMWAWWGSSVLVRMMATNAEAIVLNVDPSARVIAFVMTLALVSTSVCAVGPALRATRLDAAAALKHGPVSGGLLRRWTAGKMLVAIQVALTLVLLAGAALFTRSLQRILAQDAGFHREGLIIVSTDALAAGYSGPRLQAFHDALLDRLRRIPAVGSAGLSWYPPISDDMGSWTQSIEVNGVPADTVRQVYFNAVSPGYFATLRTRLIAGRDFTDRDRDSSTRVVVINESLARRAFGDRDPIGQRLTVGRNKSRQDLEVVGIVQDAKYQRLQEPARSIAYLPCAQLAEYLADSNLVAEIRSAADVDIRGAISRELRTLDGIVPLRIETVEDRIAESLVKERVMALLAGVLGLSALLLACAAVYGLLAYAVSRQTNEIGLRLALGASRARILWAVLRESLTVASIGVVLAVPIVVALGRFVRTLLFGVTPVDPASLGGAAGLVLTIAVSAGLLPARRASRIDPVQALKID
jgi:putative ABC transport system permease protein